MWVEKGSPLRPSQGAESVTHTASPGLIHPHCPDEETEVQRGEGHSAQAQSECPHRSAIPGPDLVLELQEGVPPPTSPPAVG